MVSPHETGRDPHGAKYAQELEGHLTWLDTFTSTALAILAVASGIYTYLGVSSLLDDTGFSFFAAIAYSIAVSVAIFVFWSYLMRLLPSVRTGAARMLFGVAMLLGSGAIIAMSSWLNAAALAGSAAVEQHLARTVQDYQTSLERAHTLALTAQALERDVARVRQSLEDLSEQEATGDLSGLAGRGAVFRLLRQKAEELSALETQIATQTPLIETAFAEGNAILSRMRSLTVEAGPVEARSILFSEDAVRMAGVTTRLRQLSVAPLVVRAANDLSGSVVLPATDTLRGEQQSTVTSVLALLGQRAETLQSAAQQVIDMPPPAEITYTKLSAADAVIRYAENFIPSWAGAIAIDLLPAVLVFMVAITQAAIRSSRADASLDDTLTLAEFRAALSAMRDVEAAMGQTGAHTADTAREGSAPTVTAPQPRVQSLKAARDE